MLSSNIERLYRANTTLLTETVHHAEDDAWSTVELQVYVDLLPHAYAHPRLRLESCRAARCVEDPVWKAEELHAYA